MAAWPARSGSDGSRFHEVLDEHYLDYRLRSVAYLGEHLLAEGIRSLNPPAGTRSTSMPRPSAAIAAPPVPGQARSGLYRHAGIRAVEIGSVMFGEGGMRRPWRDGAGSPGISAARLHAVHIDYVVEATIEVHKDRDKLRGLRILSEPPALRHFTAHFEEL